MSLAMTLHLTQFVDGWAGWRGRESGIGIGIGIGIQGGCGRGRNPSMQKPVGCLCRLVRGRGGELRYLCLGERGVAAVVREQTPDARVPRAKTESARRQCGEYPCWG